MRSFSLVIFFCLALPATHAKADKGNISKLTNELTHHIVTVLTDMRAKIVRNEGYCHQCSHGMLTRHLFQRAFDIDHHLTAFLNMYGHKTEHANIFQFKLYTDQDIIKLLNNIDEKLELVLKANDITVDHSKIKKQNGKIRDNYAVLDRIENFILSIGSPSIQPRTVLKRARAINKIVKSLCRSEICPETQVSPDHLITPKMPIHVYREVNKLTTALHTFVERNKFNIHGGITSPPVSREIITPRIVNRTSGILLADLIEIRHIIGDKGDLEIPDVKIDATPTHVWKELNFARRYLEEMNY